MSLDTLLVDCEPEEAARAAIVLARDLVDDPATSVEKRAQARYLLDLGEQRIAERLAKKPTLPAIYEHRVREARPHLRTVTRRYMEQNYELDTVFNRLSWDFYYDKKLAKLAMEGRLATR